EHDLVGFRSHGRLFGDHRGDDHVVVAKIRHLNRSSRASTAAFERTSVPRRRMSWTLMPWTGSTSILGMFEAARRKFWSTSAPPIISALERPSEAKLETSALVLASFAERSSMTMR